MKVEFSDPAEILPPGVYSFTATFRGTIVIEEDNPLTLIDALDDATSQAEMVDWEVFGKGTTNGE